MALVLFLRARVLALAMELNVAIICFNIVDALFFIFGLLSLDWEKKYYKAKLDPETKINKYLRHNREGYVIVKIREKERERLWY